MTAYDWETASFDGWTLASLNKNAQQAFNLAGAH